jgi:hypothetical protein
VQPGGTNAAAAAGEATRMVLHVPASKLAALSRRPLLLKLRLLVLFGTRACTCMHVQRVGEGEIDKDR